MALGGGAIPALGGSAPHAERLDTAMAAAATTKTSRLVISGSSPPQRSPIPFASVWLKRDTGRRVVAYFAHLPLRSGYAGMARNCSGVHFQNWLTFGYEPMTLFWSWLFLRSVRST